MAANRNRREGNMSTIEYRFACARLAAFYRAKGLVTLADWYAAKANA